MVRRGGMGYKTQAQKDGRSAGQRQRRMARDRKQRLREANEYQIAVQPKLSVKHRQYDSNELAVYGIYKDDRRDVWVLTGMSVVRSREKMLTDRQGAVTTEVVDQYVVTPAHDSLRPYDGIELTTADTKKELLRKIGAETSTRIKSGNYVVQKEHDPQFKTFHIDRDDYRNWKQNHAVRQVKD